MVKLNEDLLKFWKSCLNERKSTKNIKEANIGNFKLKQSRIIQAQNEDHFREMVNYVINTYDIWNILYIRKLFGFEDIMTNCYETFWNKTREEFLNKFADESYRLRMLHNTVRKKNIEKLLIFCKFPGVNFGICVADLLLTVYKFKFKVIVHKTISFFESSSSGAQIIDETFWKEDKRGVLDIRLNSNKCQKAVGEFKLFFDSIFKETASNDNVHVLLKTAGYVTQWHFDTNDTPMVVIYHQLKGNSYFMGVPSIYGYFFLGKAQNKNLSLNDLLNHFYKIKGSIGEDKVMQGKKKENVLVEEGDVIAVFPSAMHQVHVPDNTPQSIVIALEYRLKALNKKVRDTGFYHEYEIPKRKKRKN